MADITIPAEALTTQVFPPICVVTGAPSDAHIAIILRTFPQWIWALLPLGLLPFVVAVAMTQRYVIAVLPVTSAVRITRLRHRRIARYGATAAVVFLLIAAAGWYMPYAVALAGASAMGALILRVLTWRRFIGARLQGAQVRFSRVHQNFATAYNRWAQ